MLIDEGLAFKFRESKSMETVVGDLKSETTNGLKCSTEIKKKITSIGTSTREPNNYVFSIEKVQFWKWMIILEFVLLDIDALYNAYTYFKLQ